MQIVTDSGTDVSMSPEQMKELKINVVPLNLTLDGKTYRDGVDIKPEEFYPLLASSKGLPKTSQPSPGDFVNIYRELAKEDPEILSIHMSSGLSGTLNAAQVAAGMVPEANITHVDTKTLSVASGWQVEAAAMAIKKGWPKEKILDLLKRIGDATEIVYYLKRAEIPDTRRANQPHKRIDSFCIEYKTFYRCGKRKRYLCSARSGDNL